VSADLSQPSWLDALNESGFSPTAPTLWLLEGLIGYLTADEAAALLTRIRSVCTPGWEMLITFVGTSYEVGRPTEAPKAAPYKSPASLHSFKTDTGDTLLSECGWRVLCRTELAALARSFGRSTIPDEFGYYFVSAVV
jgi:methyltransferase (TIGR00027 family)